MTDDTGGEIRWSKCAPHALTHQRVRERSERSNRAWRHVSGLLQEVSPPIGRSGDDDPGGRVTCRR